MFSRKSLFSSRLTAGIFSFLFISSVAITSAQAAVGIAGSWLEGATHTKEPGTNRALVVMVYGEHNANFSCTGITYGGQTMTKVVEKLFYTTGNRSYTAAFVLTETGVAAASNGTIAVTWSVTPSVGKTMTSTFFTGVDQATAIGLTASNGLAGVMTITTGSLANAAGDMVLVGGTSEKGTAYTVNNGFTKGIEIAAASWGDGVAGNKSATGVNQTPSLTTAAAMRQTIIGFVLKAARGNIPPTVTITSPATGATFTMPASITIYADASDADGSVTRVQVYQGTTLLAESVSPPYGCSWGVSAAGSYTLSAIATDNLGATTTSTEIPITVVNPRYSLTVLATNGTVTLNPAGGSYEAGTMVTLTATPNDGCSFSGWSGDLSGSENPATIEMDGDKSVTALFAGVRVNSKKLSVSGELRYLNGNPLGADPVEYVDMSVHLMNQATGGSVVYSESFFSENDQIVPIENNVFTLRLGEGTTTQDLGSVLAANGHLWAEIIIGSDTPDTLSPRIPLTASPYAVAPGTGSVLHGSVDPGAGVIAPIGAYYVNDTDGSTWVKINSGWRKVL